MRSRELLCGLLLWALAAGGCAYQRAIIVSSAEPDWVLQKPADTTQKLFYVGEGHGANIVDTARARGNALADVCRQIADSLGPVAVQQAIATADQKGIAHQRPDQELVVYAQQIRRHVDQAASALQQEAFYWEKWASKAGIFDAPTYDYRYYILASMPIELSDKLTTELAHQIADDIESRGRPQAQAAPKAEESAPAPKAQQAAPTP
jgi:hypothetical protein